LKSALNSKYAGTPDPMTIHTPRNCETVELYFKSDKVARVHFPLFAFLIGLLGIG
jgi:cleavage and polyadenylation specificity factor subunit 3